MSGDQLESLVQSVIDLTFKNTLFMTKSTKEEKINYIVGKCVAITRGKVDPSAIQFYARRLL